MSSSSPWASNVVFIAFQWFCLIAEYVVCSDVGGSVGVGVLFVDVGLLCCVRLLFTQSLSIESHIKPSDAAVSQVMSLARLLFSPYAFVGCW